MKQEPTLLLVDDEARILAALHRTLRREGYSLLTAESPQRAIRLLEEEPIDLILSDHKMPGMSGLDLLRQAALLQPDAGRLLITGWAQAVSREEIDSIGIRSVVPKPWKDAELKDALRNALAYRTPPAPGATPSLPRSARATAATLKGSP